jgi:hypothetical protein
MGKRHSNPTISSGSCGATPVQPALTAPGLLPIDASELVRLIGEPLLKYFQQQGIECYRSAVPPSPTPSGAPTVVEELLTGRFQFDWKNDWIRVNRSFTIPLPRKFIPVIKKCVAIDPDAKSRPLWHILLGPGHGGPTGIY